MRSVTLYVDGYNFYYSNTNHLKRDEDRRGFRLAGLSWCDFRALIERNGWLNPGEQLNAVKYFTAPVTPDLDNPARPGEPERQQLWLDAVRTIAGLTVIEGFHRRKEDGNRHREEKQTDVNLAVEALLDALRGEFDRAILLSGDSDEIPAVLALSYRLARPRDVTVLLPLGADRESYVRRLHETKARLRDRGLIDEANHGKVSVVELSEQNLANSLLPYDRTHCPHYWRLPSRWLDGHCSPRNRPDRKAGVVSLRSPQ